jgi:hypothetical protein
MIAAKRKIIICSSYLNCTAMTTRISNPGLYALFVVLLLSGGSVVAQKKETYDLAKLLQDKKIEPFNRTAVPLSEKNVTGIKLDERDAAEGLVWLTGAKFSSGTIEVDLRGKDVLQRSFIGIAFHGVNDSTYDAIYFRPFNFRATDPVRKIHAVQYISHPLFTWKKLRDERNGEYEKAVEPAPDPTGWFHARIEVANGNIVVYVNDAKVPSLTVKKLNDRQNGKIGLWVGAGSGGDFANLSIVSK